MKIIFPLTSLIGFCIFFYSCESEPLVGLNNLEGSELKQLNFPLNQLLSETVQSENQLGDSPRLYSGRLDNGDIATAIINIRSEIISSHPVCNADIIEKFTLKINTLTDLTSDDLSVFNISTELLTITPILNLNPSVEDIDLLISQNNNAVFAADLIDYYSNKIEIDLYNHSGSILSDICEDEGNIGLIISYLPTEENVEQFIEFRSADVENSTFGPMLDLEYFINEQDTFSTNSYVIDNIHWLESSSFPEQENIQGPYVIENVDDDQWGMIYAFDTDPNQFEGTINYENFNFNSNIISNLDVPIEFLQIDLILNQDIISELDSIQFYLSNVVAFINMADPMGDNWSQTDTTGTEGNGKLDWIDVNFNGKWENGEGEQWFDDGVDNCPDSLETSFVDICNNSNSMFNSEGTENNGQLDWVDIDFNDQWNVDEGEIWWDHGVDGCLDTFESGDIENPCLINEDLSLEGTDPNGDNYLIDPNGDDWSEDELNRTEGNGTYNAGEPYFDWGLDGLPFSLSGFLDADGTEDNDVYDLGEPFDDTGSDGLFNLNEPKYNPDGTEGNQIFDGFEEFDDCGEDNNCSDSDVSDDYIIDPNGDNWNEVESIGTEGDGICNDGENFYDWGLDGIQDALEAFQTMHVIYPEIGDNIYEYNLQSELLFPDLNLDDNVISLWITEISKDSDVISIKFGIKTSLALKGLQFKLNHFPFTEIDIRPKSYEDLISHFENESLFEDITLSNYENFSGNDLEVNYSNNLSTHLYFENLEIFLENKERNLSHDFSHFILHIDKDNSEIHNQGMLLHLGYADESNEYISLNTFYVTSLIDSMIIPIGNVLRGFQNENYGLFNNLIIKTDGELYNYSKLIIKNNSDDSEVSTNPIIKLMYWE